MLDDLWNFFTEIPNEGYTVESSYCKGDECISCKGNIDPNNIWEFNLVSLDGKVTRKVETSIIDFLEPRIRLRIDSSGEKIDLDIAPKNCRITKDGFLCIDEKNQDHEFKIIIKKS
ncbi:hypothetical protein [Wolbachia endosymbiont of Cantharis cryptica]|uniref:hypothetical protein n=1 Tax=Wolbachia endosymbiont of Cantharis cryptica TaxID=3066132 RepID=UPI00376EC859